MKIEGASRKQGVVVVGGSFAGLCTIRHLKKYEDLDITLVEPKDYFEYTPGALHLLSGSKGDLLSPLADILKDSAAVVHGKFVGVSKAADTKSIVVKLIDDDLGHSTLKEVPYDALIICSGVPYTAPIRAASVLGPTLVNRLMEVDDYNKKLKGATRVIISGGGLVGVELAAEISCRLENQVKEVLLISRTTLLGSLPKEAGNLALRWLNKRKNIKLYLGDEIVGTPFKEGSNSDPSSSSAARGDEPGMTMSYRTRKGEVLSGDMFIDCTGRVAKIVAPQTSADSDAEVATTLPDTHDTNSESMKNYVSPFDMKSGLIAVDAHLMSLKFPDAGLFAAGDIVEHFPGVGFASTTQKSGPFGRLSTAPSVRNAHLAESQAELCAANVARYLSLSPSSAPPKMLQYPRDAFGVSEAPLLACVSLGPMQGIVVFNDLVVGGVLFGMLGGFIKYVIERSKIAEIRNKVWGRAFWAFGHVVVNALHVLHVKARALQQILSRPFRRSPDSNKRDGKTQTSFT